MNTLLTKSALSATIALTLVACGGGDSGGIAGIGGSGFTSSGSVTGFGSVLLMVLSLKQAAQHLI